MSKRNRNKFRDRSYREESSTVDGSTGRMSAASPASSHSAEYKIITNDLIRLVVLNAVMLAAVLVVYFTNLKSNYLESLFLKLFNI